MTKIILLTGPKHSGKTTACQRFVKKARHADMRIGGIVSPGRYDSRGKKTGIEVIDVATAKQRLLAVTVSDPQQATIGEYQFCPETMRWALERVLSALVLPLDVIIIDEIGPLEFDHEGGFAPALDRIPTSRAKIAILVLRKSLASRAQQELAKLHPTRMRLCRENRDKVPARLYGAVCNLLSATGNQSTN